MSTSAALEYLELLPARHQKEWAATVEMYVRRGSTTDEAEAEAWRSIGVSVIPSTGEEVCKGEGWRKIPRDEQGRWTDGTPAFDPEPVTEEPKSVEQAPPADPKLRVAASRDAKSMVNVAVRALDPDFGDDPVSYNEAVKDEHREYRANLGYEEHEAVTAYEDNGYTEINGFLRGKHTEEKQSKRVTPFSLVRTPTEDVEDWVGSIEAAIAAAPTVAPDGEVVVWRGAKGKWAKDLRIGDQIEDPGFVSTSVDYDEARKFATAHWHEPEGSVLYRIRLPEGTRGLYLTARDEAEILLQRNARFQVKRIVRSGAFRAIELLYLGAKAGERVERVATWDESEHPRDEGGRFTESGGSAGTTLALRESPSRPKDWSLVPKPVRDRWEAREQKLIDRVVETDRRQTASSDAEMRAASRYYDAQKKKAPREELARLKQEMKALDRESSSDWEDWNDAEEALWNHREWQSKTVREARAREDERRAKTATGTDKATIKARAFWGRKGPGAVRRYAESLLQRWQRDSLGWAKGRFVVLSRAGLVGGMTRASRENIESDSRIRKYGSGAERYFIAYRHEYNRDTDRLKAGRAHSLTLDKQPLPGLGIPTKTFEVQVPVRKVLFSYAHYSWEKESRGGEREIIIAPGRYKHRVYRIHKADGEPEGEWVEMEIDAPEDDGPPVEEDAEEHAEKADAAWDESQHPRAPAGGSDGGQFTEAGGGGGGATARPESDEQGKFDRKAWRRDFNADPIGTAKRWKALPMDEKVRLANPKVTVNARRDELVTEKWPATTGDVRRDIQARLAQHENQIHPESSRRAADLLTRLSDTYERAGAPKEAAERIVRHATDMLLAQEMESQTRLLGDHGVAHISGDASYALRIARVMPGEPLTPREEAIFITAALYHDTGYLTPPMRSGQQSKHPAIGAVYFGEHVRPMLEDAFGAEWAREVGRLVAKHDDENMDLSDRNLTAMSLADGLALFQREKLPPMLRAVPANIDVLVRHATGEIDLTEAKRQMKDNITEALPNLDKRAAMRFVSSLDDFNVKNESAVLGMLGVRIHDIRWEDEHLKVDLLRGPANKALGKVVDLHLTQFEKLLADFKVGPENISDGFTLERDGRKRVSFAFRVRKVLEALGLFRAADLEWDENDPKGR